VITHNNNSSSSSSQQQQTEYITRKLGMTLGEGGFLEALFASFLLD
jgi:hypothetical protein